MSRTAPLDIEPEDDSDAELALVFLSGLAPGRYFLDVGPPAGAPLKVEGSRMVELTTGPVTAWKVD
jgi:hypothetical protein